MIVGPNELHPKSLKDEPFYEAIVSTTNSFSYRYGWETPEGLLKLLKAGEFQALWFATRQPFSKKYNNFLESRRYHEFFRRHLFSQFSFPISEIVYVLEKGTDEDNIISTLKLDALSHPSLPKRILYSYLERDYLDAPECEALLKNPFTPKDFIEKVFNNWKNDNRYTQKAYRSFLLSAICNPNIPIEYFTIALDRKNMMYSSDLLMDALLNLSFPPELLYEASEHSEDAAMAACIHIKCPLATKAKILLHMEKELLGVMLLEDPNIENSLDSWLKSMKYDQDILNILPLEVKLTLVSD